MNGFDSMLYYVAAVLQVAAMFFAIRMMREVKDSRPWIALFGALVIMFVMRIVALTVPEHIRLQLQPIAAPLVSAFLFVALFSIRAITAAQRESSRLAELRTAERDESEDRYRSMSDLSPDAMLVTVMGKISYVNHVAQRLLGAETSEHLIGRRFAEFAPESAVPQDHGLSRIGENDGAKTEQWRRLDGSTFPVETAAGVVPWRGGTAVQLIVRDISERTRTEEEKTRLLASESAARSVAEHASRMKDEFLATLSHELRTPLNAILGWSQILRQNPSDGEELRQGLETIERNARVQTELVEDLLDMSRIVSGKLRLHIQRVVPATFVEAAVEAVRPGAEAKGVRLESTLDTTAGPISADPNRLQQVVWNLLSNSLKFTPKGGKVQVRMERVNSHIEITVADTGAGVAEEFLPHVFDRFRQADSSTTRKQGGLGLGLAIVKQLVDLHGGSVKMTSPGEGLGTSVVICLPITVVHSYIDDAEDRAHPKSSVLLPHMTDGVSLRGIKILIVDDEPDALAMLRRLLERNEAQVLSASSAAAAIPLLQQDRPDVLISDIGMPEKDGYAFLTDVRNLPPETGGRIPAIALTAFARSEDRTRALIAGYQVHLSKPVEPQELIVTVASLVGRMGKPDRAESGVR